MKSPSNHGLRALLRAFFGGGALLCSAKKARTARSSVPKRHEFLSWPLVQEKVKCQVAQEAEVFCSSLLGLNTTQSDRNQKFMCSHSSTSVSYEKWAGSLWSYQTASTVKICQPRAYVAHLSQNVKTQGKCCKSREKCPSFHSWLKLMLAKLQSLCPYSVSFMENRFLQCLGVPA